MEDQNHPMMIIAKAHGRNFHDEAALRTLAKQAQGIDDEKPNEGKRLSPLAAILALFKG